MVKSQSTMKVKFKRKLECFLFDHIKGRGGPYADPDTGYYYFVHYCARCGKDLDKQ